MAWAMFGRIERVGPDGLPLAQWELDTGLVIGFTSYVPLTGG